MVTAVRRSGAPFTGAYNVRSETFDDYLLKRDLWMKRVSELREQIGVELYACVPRQNSSSARAVLLRAKRNIWNCRPVAPADILQINDHIGAMVREYNTALGAIADLLSSRRTLIIAEIKRALRTLVHQPRFRSAVNYACPWLIDAYERNPAPLGSDFSNEERGLFSYGVKFFSKATPLHLFATVGLPQETGWSPEEFCEIVINTGFVLQLERTALSDVNDPYRRYVYLRPHLDEGDVWLFLTRSPGKVRIVSIRSNPILSGIASFLSDSSVPRSLGECEDALLTRGGDAGRDDVRKYLASLLHHNVLAEFLISDFRRFAVQLSGCDPALDGTLESLAECHLKPIEETRLTGIQSALRTIDIPVLGTPTYYVNSYCSGFKMPSEEIVDRIANDLRDLKIFLTAIPNTARRVDSLTQLLLCQLRRYPSGQAPYLSVVYDCLRNWGSNGTGTDYMPHSGLSHVATEGWLKSVGEVEGAITASDLKYLRPDVHVPDLPNICCNGPIDYCCGRFFPTNILSGDGRFVSRYLLYKSTTSYRRGAGREHEEALDVQLVPPFSDSRLFVRSLYPVGCGFESRYRYEFEQWIDPSEIRLEIRDGRVRYRHTQTQRLLRIHYAGFLLSEFLTPEYALLLLDHADTYTNPFSVRPKTERIDTIFGSVARVPELLCGAICLRREEFRIPASALQRALDGKDLLEVSASFRDNLHLVTGKTTEHWYVRTPRASKGGWKPRYLDLRNALSVQLLRRDIASLQADATISFSCMDPPIEHLSSEGNDRFTTEFMIEI